MKKPLVSVIIVNWNGKKWLQKCLFSIFSQTYKNLEVIVVDNNSVDGSTKFIKKYFPKTKLIVNETNFGYPKAVNIGINLAQGKYLLLMNNDVWVKRNFLQSLCRYYENNDFSVISPIVKSYNGGNLTVNLPNIDPTGSPAYFYPLSRKDKLFYLSTCYFCSKKVYLSTLGFDDNYFAYYEDVDWFWRLNLLGKKFSYVPSTYIFHEGAGVIGAGIKYKMFLYRNQNALQTLIKNYSLPSLLLILPLYIFQNIVEMVFFILILRPKIAFTYLEGWFFNFKNLGKILEKRAWVQKNRIHNDFTIMRRMYLGPAKLKMLINYL